MDFFNWSLMEFLVGMNFWMLWGMHNRMDGVVRSLAELLREEK